MIKHSGGKFDSLTVEAGSLCAGRGGCAGGLLVEQQVIVE